MDEFERHLRGDLTADYVGKTQKMRCQKILFVCPMQHAGLYVSEKRGHHEFGSGYANFELPRRYERYQVNWTHRSGTC